MSNPEINAVLAQMRVLAQDIRPASEAGVPQAQPPGTEFANAMADALKSVNEAQGTAKDLVNRFETGQDDTSVAEVMVAMQKASVEMQAMTEVRNRLVEAYREIMSMPL